MSRHLTRVLAALLVSAASCAAAAPSSSAANPTYVAVSGNHLIDAGGHTLRLLGVNRSGSEYMCVASSQIFDGPVSAASVQAMAGWRINAVRVPLNEDCWLGINGAMVSASAYRDAIVAYVSQLQAHGLIVILDLHWNAPGGLRAEGQSPMADADHAPAFWSSVASTFAANHGVIFDLYNEPYINSWQCWLAGCTSSFSTGSGSVPYQTSGMQQLVEAVRATGATQPLMLGGLEWSSDDSHWLQYMPRDAAHQLVVSFHTYNFSGCHEASCWESSIAPLARQVPVVTGELGQSGCAHSYIDKYMSWADAHGVSYLGWTWDSTGPPSNWSCSEGPALIRSYNGTPTGFGEGLKKHLAKLASVARRRR